MYRRTTRARARDSVYEEVTMSIWTSRARGASARAIVICTFAAGLVSAAAACAGPRPLALPGRGGDPREFPGSSGEIGARATEGGVSAKRVTGKEPPTTLIAEDGTRCTVTEKRYDETRIGDQTLCAWRKG
jgi:hypothetical protein